MAKTSFDKSIERPHCSAADLTREPKADKTPCVRLYTSSPGRATLQIRSVGTTAPGGTRGRAMHHIVSSADMDVSSAKYLVSLLQAFIAGDAV